MSIVQVTHGWDDKHGPCYGCGDPAAFYAPDMYSGDDEPPRRENKLCAVCAINVVVDDGERVLRIADEDAVNLGPDLDALGHINWDKVLNISDVRVLPQGFRADRDTGNYPEGVYRLDRIQHGDFATDKVDERFQVMGYGAVQGSYVLRNDWGQMFQADGETLLRPVD